MSSSKLCARCSTVAIMITNNNHPSTVRGGFDSNAYENVEEALSQSEMQENIHIQGRSIKPTFLESLQNLLRQKEDANSWTSPPILICVAESLESSTIIQIDIAETLVGQDKGRNVPSPEKRNNDNCYWFSNIFNSNDEKFWWRVMAAGNNKHRRGDCFFFLSKMRVAESGFQREAGEGGTKRGEEFSCLLYGIDPFGRLPTYPKRCRYQAIQRSA